MKSHTPKHAYRNTAAWDVAVFALTLLAAHFFWKYTVVGEEIGDTVTWFGLDLSALFAAASRHTAEAVYAVVHCFRPTLALNGTMLSFDSGNYVAVVWSCTGFKQAFIWMFLILTARGPIWHKIWYIPLGWICVYGVNVLRIAAIAGIVEFHPEMFELFHRYVFKYLFYFILFMMWVFWLEKFAPQTPSAS